MMTGPPSTKPRLCDGQEFGVLVRKSIEERNKTSRNHWILET